MRVAVVFSEFHWPPKGGLFEMTRNLLQALCDEGHQVDLYGFSSSPGSIKSGDKPEWWTKDVTVKAVFPGKYPWLIQALRVLKLPLKSLNDAERSIVTAMQATSYDLCFVEGIGGAGFAKYCRDGVPVVLNLIDSPSHRALKLSGSLKFLSAPWLKNMLAYWMGRMAETASAPHVSRVIVVSPLDKTYLLGAKRFPDVAVLPITLPPAMSRTNHVPPPSLDQAGQLKVFISIDLTQAYLLSGFECFIDEVLKPLAGSCPGLTVDVAGRIQPSEEWMRRCDGLNIRFHVWIDDLIAEMQAADVVVVPDASGSGLKNRALVALYSGRPVLLSPAAAEGLNLSSGRECLILQDSVEWVRVLQEMYDQGAGKYARNLHGRSFVVDEYGYETFRERLSRALSL